MKDIDFDELDRAVSSVLAGNAVPQPEDQTPVSAADTPLVTAVESPQPPVLSIDDNAPAEPETVNAPDDTPVVADEPATQVSATPLAIKRRGKFMDVVHPSSDMNPNAAVVPAAPSVSRRTLSPLIAPSLDDQKVDATEQAIDTAQTEAVVDEGPVLEATAVEPDTVALVPEVTNDTTQDQYLDSSFSTEGVDASAEPAEQQEPADVPATSPIEPSSVVDDAPVPALDGFDLENDMPEATEPSVALGETDTVDADALDPDPLLSAALETPFLTDAKVEKRPLGEFGDVAPEQAAESAEPIEDKSVPDASLPRELQPDVVEVEAIRDDTKEPVSHETASAPVIATVPVAELESERTHSLFDTSTYHEPIVAAKKSSAPVWVWWLIGLLVCLAAGAGVGYFLFVSGI